MAADPKTFGWDTVFAISVADVNRVLQGLPASPSYTASSPISGDGTATLRWQFTSWTITNVSGPQIELALYFAPGSTLTVDGQAPVPLDDPDWYCRVTVTAFWTDETQSRLVAHTAPSAAGTKWASIQVNAPDGVGLASLYASGILRKWFAEATEALALFKQEFATFDMSADIGSHEIPWLVPTKLGFAGGTMDGGAQAIGILAMTNSGRSAADAELRLSEAAIPPNASAGFVISRHLFMTNMILPGAAAAYSDDSVGDTDNFALSGADLEKLTNIKTLNYHLKVEGRDEPCTIGPGGVTMEMAGNRLSITVKDMTMPSQHLGFVASVSMKEDLSLSLLPKPKDPQSLYFAMKNESTEKPKVSQVPGTGLTVALSIIAAAIAAISIALMIGSGRVQLMNRFNLTAAQAKFWARVIAACVAGVGLAAGTIVGIVTAVFNAEEADIPPITPLLNTHIGRLSWPGAGKSEFVATSGRFANSVQLAVDVSRLGTT